MWLNQKFYASKLCPRAGAEALAQASVARY